MKLVDLHPQVREAELDAQEAIDLHGDSGFVEIAGGNDIPSFLRRTLKGYIWYCAA
jgi:hypothetical protein